jgi:ABC-type glutathione transport system ATPase component
MTDALLTGRGITKDHHLPRQKLGQPRPVKRVLHDVDIDIHAGETLAIIGESGSGKSTLVRILLGLQRSTSGTVSYDGKPVTVGRSPDTLWLRRRTGIVLQDPYSSLDPRMTVARSIVEPLRALGIGGNHRAMIHDVLERVGLPAERASSYPHTLSGGQRQRVAIARAIVHGPELLVGDEPMSALDVTIRAAILDLLDDLRDERGMGLVLVSHDLGLVRHHANKVAVLQDGYLVEYGDVADVFLRPHHPYTRALVEATPRLPSVSSKHTTR